MAAAARRRAKSRCALTAAWIAIGRLTPVPDLSEYRTTIYRWSLFVMSPVVAGVVEEAAFRGYMQRGLERLDPRNAVWMTSLVFVASHITHGVDAVIVLGPGIFAASMLYGHLALRSATRPSRRPRRSACPWPRTGFRSTLVSGIEV